MKKYLCLMLSMLLLMSVLAGCSDSVCQYCGEKDCESCGTFFCESCETKKTGQKYKDTLLGREYIICRECYEALP